MDRKLNFARERQGATKQNSNDKTGKIDGSFKKIKFIVYRAKTAIAQARERI